MTEPKQSHLFEEIGSLLEDCLVEEVATFLGQLAEELERTGDTTTVLMKLRGFKKNYQRLVGD